VLPEVSTAISPEAKKAAMRVNKPNVISSPAINWIAPAHHIGKLPIGGASP
jgi:hypothetical protein